MKYVRRFSPAVLLIASVALLGGRAVAKDTREFASTKPVPRNDAWWQDRNKSMNERVKKGNVDLLMIGDSITHGWEGSGKEVWKQYYGKRNAVNLGIGGDQTQHVLWRLENGNIAGIQPKLAVLMIGTNNAGCGNPLEIAAGVKAIVTKLRTSLPQTKVLLLAIFPRGADTQDHLRQVNAKTNQIIAKLADDKDVLLSGHRAEVCRQGRQAAAGDHARLAAPQRQGLWDLGRSDRAYGQEVDGREVAGRGNRLDSRLDGRLGAASE